MSGRETQKTGPGVPAWWRPVWVCLAGEQALPNVLPVLHYASPQKVIFLHTELQGSREAARRSKMFLERRGIACRVKETSAYEPRKVTEDVAQLAARHGLGETLLNYTGGTKIMSLASYTALPEYVPKIYFDIRKGVMHGLDAFEPLPPGPALDVADFFSINADVRVDPSVLNPITAEHSSKVLVRALDGGEVPLGVLLQYRTQVLSKLKGKKRGWMPATESIPVPFERRNPELAAELLQALLADGLFREGRTGPIPTENGLDFLEGFWWEHYVHAKLTQGFREAGLGQGETGLQRNVTFLWKNGRAMNEIDLAFVFRNRLFLISCTTASLSEAEKRREQVEVFASRLGGHFGRPMLATTLGHEQLDVLLSRKAPHTKVPAFNEWKAPKTLIENWCFRN